MNVKVESTSSLTTKYWRQSYYKQELNVIPDLASHEIPSNKRQMRVVEFKITNDSAKEYQQGSLGKDCHIQVIAYLHMQGASQISFPQLFLTKSTMCLYILQITSIRASVFSKVYKSQLIFVISSTFILPRDYLKAKITQGLASTIRAPCIRVRKGYSHLQKKWNQLKQRINNLTIYFFMYISTAALYFRLNLITPILVKECAT